MEDEEGLARELNERLVEALLADGSIRSPQVEAAFRAVLRHHFLPDAPLEEVYRAKAIVTRVGSDGLPTSSSSDPRIMARMLEQLEVQPGQHVLEIGAGTGYNAALLSRLTGEEGMVTTVDIDPAVTAAAAANLWEAGFDRVLVVTADGWAGVPSPRPYDRIEATVGVWDLATPWIEQLRTGGILAVPLWLRAGLQASVAFRKSDSGLHSRSIEPCGFMRLQGLGAGPERYTRLRGWTANFDQARSDEIAVLDRLLQQQPRTQRPPTLAPGWFTPVALTSPTAITLADWAAKVTLSGLFDPAGPSLAVVEADLGTSRSSPRALHVFGTNDALESLLALIEQLPPVHLAEVVIHARPPYAEADHERVLACLVRPNTQFLVTTTSTV